MVKKIVSVVKLHEYVADLPGPYHIGFAIGNQRGPC